MPARVGRILAVLAVLVNASAAAAGAGDVHLVIQEGHEGHVTCAAFSPDGRSLVTGSRDGTARVWDLASGRLVRSFAGHPHGVSAVAFSPDGRHLLTGAEDARARIFRLSDGHEVRRFHGHLPHVEITLRGNSWPERGRVTAVAMSADGRRLLTAGNDETARIWSVATGREIHVLLGHRMRVYVARFVDGDRRVLTAGQDGTARLWNAGTGREIRRFAIRREDGLARRITAAAMTPDGERLVTGCADGVSRIWETRTGREMQRTAGDREAVTALSIDEDGRSMLAGTADGVVRRYDLETTRVLGSWTGAPDGAPDEGAPVLAFSADGALTAVAPESRRLEVRNTRTGRLRIELRGTVLPVRSGAFTADGDRLVLGLEDGSIAVHDLVSDRVAPAGATLTDAVTAVAVSRDGALIVAGGEDGVIRFVRPGTGEHPSGVAGQGEVLTLVLTPDERVLVSACADGSVWIWHPERAERLRRLSVRTRQGRVTDIAVDPAGRHCAVAVGRWVEIFDLLTGLAIGQCEGHFSAVTSVRYSPDGRWLITGGAEGTVRLWSAGDGQPLRRFEGILVTVVDVVLTPDLRRVLALTEDGTIHVWDTTIASRQHKIEGAIRAPRSLALSPDGTTLVVLGGGPEAVVVNLAGRRVAGRILHTSGASRAVVDVAGRYDLSEPGAAEGAHWRFGTTIVTLDRLAGRYRTPRLLTFLLGRTDRAVGEVVPLSSLGPPPDVRIDPMAPGSTVLRYRLIDRGGGTGSIRLRIDGQEHECGPPGSSGAIDLSAFGAGPGSRVEIFAFGEGDHVRSRSLVITIETR